jgi:hypothetical protein
VLDERRRNGILLSTATLAPSPRGAQPPLYWFGVNVTAAVEGYRD